MRVNSPAWRDVEGYGLTVTGDNGKTQELTKDGEISFAITNTYKADQITVTIKKVWEDSENQDGLRPESIDVILLANGKESTTITLKEESDWTATFSVDEYADGDPIEYTVKEPEVKGYKAKIASDTTKGLIFTITNTHTFRRRNAS